MQLAEHGDEGLIGLESYYNSQQTLLLMYYLIPVDLYFAK